MSNPIPDLSRIRFLCRRGMKELDVLLQRFLDRHYVQASATEQQDFVRLLDREDPQLWAWVLGSETPPAEFQHVLARIRAHA